ncbi:MAG: hydroxymethylbilane synthase [Rickettsiaceae bacterium]|nr:MAG: hydroxymethylbilane synthase [Rickettsiaceae bacterium]
MLIKIGSRKSKLAIAQTNLVIAKIKQCFPQAICEIIPITTTGDIITHRSLRDIGGKVLFLKEIEQQLVTNKINMAVHSLKDMPGVMPEGLIVSAVLEQIDARDAFVSFKYKSLADLPKNAIIGSSSVRRKAFLLRIRPDFKVVLFRGNVDSRIDKLKNGEVDATILGIEGMKRLGIYDHKYCQALDPSIMLPAIGQGVIGVEIREDNLLMKKVCAQINHEATWYKMEVERSFLKYLNADCEVPLAANSTIEDEFINTDFMLASENGSKMIFHSESGHISNAKSIGIRAARHMLKLS